MSLSHISCLELKTAGGVNESGDGVFFYDDIIKILQIIVTKHLNDGDQVFSEGGFAPMGFSWDSTTLGDVILIVSILLTKDGLGAMSSANCHAIAFGQLHDGRDELAFNMPAFVEKVNSGSTKPLFSFFLCFNIYFILFYCIFVLFSFQTLVESTTLPTTAIPSSLSSSAITLCSPLSSVWIRKHFCWLLRIFTLTTTYRRPRHSRSPLTHLPRCLSVSISVPRETWRRTLPIISRTLFSRSLLVTSIWISICTFFDVFLKIFSISLASTL